MQRSLLLALASAATFALMAAAPADAAVIHRTSVRVSYADLDIDNQAGAAALLGRIRSAARAVCGDYSGPISLRARAAIRQCENARVEKAVTDVNNPALTALYSGRPTVTVRDL